MDPPIRYVRNSDGTRIAYAVAGQGPVLVRLPYPGLDGARAFSWNPALRDLAEHFTVVIYDARGSGLSQRDVTDISLDAMVADLRAVVAAVALPTLSLWAATDLSPVAIRFAAENPDRVDCLVLHDPYSRGSDYRDSPFRQFDRVMEHADWDLYLQTFVKVNLEVPDPLVRQTIRMIKQNISRELWWTYPKMHETWDVDAFLPNIRAKTLIVDNRESYMGVGARLASDIPAAEYMLTDDRHYSDVSVDIEFILHNLAAPQEPEPASAPSEPVMAELRSGMTAILFLDIADSTSLTERMGDAAFRAAARRLDDSAREAIRAARGTPVEGKVLGDGVMAVFASAADAVEGACRCFELSAQSELKLHIGVHAGDVIQEGNTVYGGAVNIAARICSLCEPGEILVSSTVRELARTSTGVAFESRGEHDLKGIQDPVRIYAIR